MLLARIPGAADMSGAPTLMEVGLDDRGRLSGLVIRTFRSIAESWSPIERERPVLPGRSAYHPWMRKA